MYRAQMTDTELEAFYMEGEFKPDTNVKPLHPKHMTDTELAMALKETQTNTDVVFTPEENQVLVEHIKRQNFIQSNK